MSVLNKIACFQNRRDEVPNQELARSLAQKKDRKGIQEIAENLWNENAPVQSDCLKVLYEIGYLNPGLISRYVDDFMKLLESNNNRLVWGSMIALSTIAELKAAEIFERHEAIQQAMKVGSVITVDNGIKTLALVAAGDPRRRKQLVPYLLRHLESCRPKEIPQHSEKILIAISGDDAVRFVGVLEKRFAEMTPAQQTRVKRVIRQAQKQQAR
jgi:hypothetical protein